MKFQAKNLNSWAFHLALAYVFIHSQANNKTLASPFDLKIPKPFADDKALIHAEEDETEPLPSDFWQSASSNSKDKKQKSSQNIGSDITAQVKVKDIIAQADEYTYASFTKVNPFVPPLLSESRPKVDIPIISILQRYSLDEFSIVGVWTLENQTRKALVMTPKKEGVIVTVGDPMGDRGGKVVSIDAEVVKVREFTVAPDGSRQFQDYELWLGNVKPAAQDYLKVDLPSEPADTDSIEPTEKDSPEPVASPKPAEESR